MALGKSYEQTRNFFLLGYNAVVIFWKLIDVSEEHVISILLLEE
jgi:hypothetical protein